jgi:penicillin-binding protein 1A
LVLVVAATLGASVYVLSRVPLPAAHPQQQTTFVYDSAGHVLATFSEQNRVDVTLKQVPKVVVDAVVSTEDRHFFTEGALNPLSIVRAAISDVTGSGNLQGGSTITQQYVKQAYLSSERTLNRKVKEAALAVRLSRTESKDEILQNYLNTIYWGRGAYGIQAAARAYFGKDASQLQLPQASLLAAMIRDPDGTDPSRVPKVARQRQTDTLRAMLRDRKIDQQQVAAVEATPFTKYVIAPNAPTGQITSAAGDQYFVEAVRQELVAKYGQATLEGGGLRVTTTLDPTLQANAYSAVYGPNGLNPKTGGPSGALVSIDNNGEVRALVGGQDYTKGSTVDLALGAAGGGSGRQAGSTFKAFMLAELIKLGYSPLSTFPAPPEVVIPHGNANGTPWDVKNFEGEIPATPTMSLVDATAHSINTVYAQVVDRLGPPSLVSMAEALGIKASELGAYPSLVLGTADVSPLEMAAAYATFSDNGVYHAPLLVTRVTRADGSPLPLPVQPTKRVVLTPAQAAEESYVLQQVVLQGTGTAAGGLGSPVAGKTGTTQNSADAWFIGYTPSLTTALWMGYASGSIPMGQVQGGTIPAELWHSFMASALASEPQWGGQFPLVNSLNGTTLSPPPESSLEFPQGLGTTTTTSTSTTTTSTTTTVPRSTTTVRRSTTTTSRPRLSTTTVPHTTTTTLKR